MAPQRGHRSSAASQNRGAVVKPFGPQQLRQIYHLHKILEAEAARCACGSFDRIALEALDEELLDLDREMGG